MTLPPYAQTFRGLPACPCQVEWIPAFEEHCRQTIPGFQGTLALAQLIGTYSKSGDTHSGGGASDFWLTGKMADLVVAEARKAGADPTWHRKRPTWSGDEHVHSILRGCPHLSDAAQVQVACVDRNDDGLSGDAPDSGPRPLSGRTWRQGIAWMKEQDMTPQQAQQLDGLTKAVAGLADMVEALAEGNDAIKRRVTKAKKEVLAAVKDDE